MQQLVESIELDQLPSLPEVLLRILQEFSSEHLQVRDLANLIIQDATLTLKILAVANSAAYRSHRPITSIEQCINLLGFKMVKIITVSASTQQFLNTLSGIVPVNFTQFWQHSVMTASISEMLAELVGYPHPQEAYIAGLLHDVGKLALLVAKPVAYKPLFQVSDDSAEHLEQELNVLGISHAEIGSMLVRHWSLEPLIADAIRYHHESFQRIGSATELIKIVVLANSLSKIGLGANQHPSLAIAHALFDLDAAKALQLCAEANARVIALATPLGIKVQANWLPLDLSENRQPIINNRTISIQRQLAEEIRTSTMLDLAQDDFSAAKSEKELLSGILKSASILFEPRQAYLFEWNVETNLISGKPVLENQESIDRIRFPLSADKSLIADALLWNTMTSSSQGRVETAPSMIDEQLIRIANAGCIYCAPMATQNFMYGVLVLAFPVGTIERVDKKLRFFTQFARQAAVYIENFRHDLETSNQLSPPDVESYKMYARQIVHEASNPLSILKNYLKLLGMKLKNGQPAELEIKILNEEIDRVSNTIHRLVESPVEQDQNIGEVDVNTTIRGTLAVCEPSIFAPSMIAVETRLDDHLPIISADSNSLKQVLINLFKNAAEAMPDGGVLTVATASVISQHNSSAISISISDNGPGVPQDILNNLFSPVATTKGKHNAGLGLSIVSGIVQEMGGNIYCKSTPRTGTTFEIKLPLRPH